MNKTDKQTNPFKEGEAAPPANGDTVTLTVDGQQITLTMDQLIQAAVSGLSRRGEMIRMAGASGQVPNGQVYANFIAAYPDVQPGDIPQEVWQDAQTEGSLVSAYRKYEIALLKARLQALAIRISIPPAGCWLSRRDGQPAQMDPVIAALRGEM